MHLGTLTLYDVKPWELQQSSQTAHFADELGDMKSLGYRHLTLGEIAPWAQSRQALSEKKGYIWGKELCWVLGETDRLWRSESPWFYWVWPHEIREGLCCRWCALVYRHKEHSKTAWASESGMDSEEERGRRGTEKERASEWASKWAINLIFVALT